MRCFQSDHTRQHLLHNSIVKHATGVMDQLEQAQCNTPLLLHGPYHAGCFSCASLLYMTVVYCLLRQCKLPHSVYLCFCALDHPARAELVRSNSVKHICCALLQWGPCTWAASNRERVLDSLHYPLSSDKCNGPAKQSPGSLQCRQQQLAEVCQQCCCVAGCFVIVLQPNTM